MRALTVIALLAWLSGGARADDSTECVDDSGDTCAKRVGWGGSVRFRAERWNNFAFLPDADDGFVLGRLQIRADARLNDMVRLIVEGKSALSTQRNLPAGQRTLDVDTLELQHASVYVRFGRVSGRYSYSLLSGRQALQYGRQRLVSPLPWGNALRAWDGARFRLDSSKWQVDAFYTWFVPVLKYDSNRRDSDEPFSGIYATFRAQNQRGLDAYWLRRERANAAFNGTSGAERRDTLGVRLFHQTGPWRGDLELAWQTGEVGTSDISAGMIALEIARFWEERKIESVTLGLDYASGDRAAGGRVETFDHLYPLAHPYFGHIDIIGRQNLVSSFVRGRFRVSATTVLEVTGLTFARARREDGLYNGGGGVVRAGDASSERHVGEELDITLSRPLGSAGRLLIGYSRFFPGQFIETSGPSATTDFGYVQYLLTF